MDQLPIAVVERETGLSKDTLRVWERRYGYPQPGRDAFGDRVYCAADVIQLRLLKRLLDKGHRPAKIVGLSIDRLTELSQVVEPSDREATSMQGEEVLSLLQQSSPSDLRDYLAHQLATAGMVGFICDCLAPLASVVGEAWAQGRVGVAQEHLFTEIVTRLLRTHLQNFPANSREGKKFLFATLPGEQHGLGLLMAECLVAVKGHTVIPLGTEVPMKELLWACDAYHCDVIALSFSQARSAAFVTDGVKTIRAMLPPSVGVWIGGSGAAHLKPVPAGVLAFRQLTDLRDEVSLKV